jgi:hypothetical protein
MLGRLTAWPAAQTLVREVAAFYGDFLEYHEDASFSGGWTTVAVSAGPKFDYLSIELEIGTGEEPETLGHELLHAAYSMKRRPIPFLADDGPIPAELRGRLGPIYGMIRTQLHSYVQHELMVEDFVRMGFDVRKFVRVPDPGDFDAAAGQQIALLNNPAVARGAFPYWCLEYFLMWTAARQGQPTQQWARNAITAASRVFPEFPETAVEIERWVSAGRFRNPDQFTVEMARLCDLMRLPPTTTWIVLVEGSEPGRPVAVALP